MRRITFIFLLLLTSFTCLARDPFGDFICRYIVTNPNTYYQVYNPIKITHQGIQVKNTKQGTKTWEAKYQGVIRITNNGGSYRFHNFYLLNQHVEFSISEDAFMPYNGKKYHVIIFDGQVQLAEPNVVNNQQMREYDNESKTIEQKRKEWDEKYGGKYDPWQLLDENGNFLPVRP